MIPHCGPAFVYSCFVLRGVSTRLNSLCKWVELHHLFSALLSALCSNENGAAVFINRQFVNRVLLLLSAKKLGPVLWGVGTQSETLCFHI